MCDLGMGERHRFDRLRVWTGCFLRLVTRLHKGGPLRLANQLCGMFPTSPSLHTREHRN